MLRRFSWRAVVVVGVSAAIHMLDASSAALAAPPGIKQEFLFASAPFPECHAATIAETPDGLAAAWFGGTEEGHADVGIWLSRRVDGAWTVPVEIADGRQADGARQPTWNPVLFQVPGGPLRLYYKAGPSPRAWWGMAMHSTDGGRTWSRPQRLPEGVIGPVKNKPVVLGNGDLLAGSSTEHDGWRVHFERSVDGGASWVAQPPVHDGVAIGAIQPSLLLHGGERLQAIGRTRQGRLFVCWSEDAGRTWGPLSLSGFPNPNSGSDAVTLADGRHLLVSNPVERGRSPLTVAVSRDGLDWTKALVLEDEPGAEFSYPAVIQGSDGKVHVAYTWKRARIRHAELDLADLAKSSLVEGDPALRP
jgi:predicted neuraminidase